MAEPQTSRPTTSTDAPWEGLAAPTHGMGYGRRLWATVLDLLCWFVLDYVLTTVALSITNMHWWQFLIRLAGFLSFVALFQSSRLQATPGQLAFGMRVVDRSGNRLTLGRAYARAALFLVGFIPAGLGSFMSLLHPRRLTLHDIASGSRVVGR